MSSGPDRSLDALAESLGHRFADESLLARALTHSSIRAKTRDQTRRDNERLEFLGDRVLALIVAEMLFKSYPDSPEGGLARRFNVLVRRETCAEIARDIDLGRHLRLGAGEARAGGRRKVALLGNACEAIIAALYLDGGIGAARQFIERHWGARIEALDEAPSDAKTALQEWSQGRGLPAPEYRVAERSGPDHAPHFEVEVLIEGHDAVRGAGKSKQAAEKAAARAFTAAHRTDDDDGE